MITHYKRDQLGHANHGWLDSRFHFSFAEYYDPARMHFGDLRVINDDLIAPASGFDPHPHRNMEIITYVRAGTVLHRDSLGNAGATGAGDVQVMSAGTGITHSEYSDADIETRLFQIWIIPNKLNVAPRWDQAKFSKVPVTGALNLLVSGDVADADRGALFINANAKIHGGVLAAGGEITHPVAGRAYILASSGTVNVDGIPLETGDGAEVTAQDKITLRAPQGDAEILVIDLI